MKFQHETVEEEDDLFHCREKLSLLWEKPTPLQKSPPYHQHSEAATEVQTWRFCHHKHRSGSMCWCSRSHTWRTMNCSPEHLFIRPKRSNHSCCCSCWLASHQHRCLSVGPIQTSSRFRPVSRAELRASSLTASLYIRGTVSLSSASTAGWVYVVVWQIAVMRFMFCDRKKCLCYRKSVNCYNPPCRLQSVTFTAHCLRYQMFHSEDCLSAGTLFNLTHLLSTC